MVLIDCLLLINQSLWHCLQHDTVVNNPLKVEMLRAAAARGIASDFSIVFLINVDMMYVVCYHIFPMYTANVCRDLQGLYREIRVRGFQIYGDCMYTCNPCNFWSKSKKVWTFYINTLLRFFEFPYNFWGDFRRTCNPRDNYMHFTGYVLRHGDPPHFSWGKNLQCNNWIMW